MTKNPWEVRGRSVESLFPERTGISGGGWERTLLLRRTKHSLFVFLPTPRRSLFVSPPDGCRSSISLHSDNLRNSRCPHFRPPSPEAGWRRERGPGGPGGAEAVDAARAEPTLAAFSRERPSGRGGGDGTLRAAGTRVSRTTRCPPAPQGLWSRGHFGGSRGTRSPRSGGAHRAQFRRRPGGGAGAADQVTERRSRLREAAWFSAAAAAAVTATPSGGAGKGGPAGWGGGTGVESAAGGGGRAAGRRAEASAAAAVSRRGWARGMGAPR